MSKLTTADRNNLLGSTFALPGRRFPMPDANHARNALSRVVESYHKGNVSASQMATVRAKANRVLGK